MSRVVIFIWFRTQGKNDRGTALFSAFHNSSPEAHSLVHLGKAVEENTLPNFLPPNQDKPLLRWRSAYTTHRTYARFFGEFYSLGVKADHMFKCFLKDFGVFESFGGGSFEKEACKLETHSESRTCPTVRQSRNGPAASQVLLEKWYLLKHRAIFIYSCCILCNSLSVYPPPPHIYAYVHVEMRHRNHYKPSNEAPP